MSSRLAAALLVTCAALAPLVAMPARATASNGLPGALNDDGGPEVPADFTRLTLVSPLLAAAPADARGHAGADGSPSTGVTSRALELASVDSQALWVAAGTSALFSLGAHVLVGTPVLLTASLLVSGALQTHPFIAVPVLLGAGGAYLVAHAAAAGLVATTVFNAVSRSYEADWLAAFGGHVAGALVAGTVVALPFAAGGFLLDLVMGLTAFTGGAGVSGLGLLTVLGALPATIIGALVILAAPAAIATWAMATSARPKPGFAFGPASLAASSITRAHGARGASQLRAGSEAPPTGDRAAPDVVPVLAWAFPGP